MKDALPVLLTIAYIYSLQAKYQEPQISAIFPYFVSSLFKVSMTRFRLDSMIVHFAQFMACFSIGTMEKQAINFPQMTLEIP